MTAIPPAPYDWEADLDKRIDYYMTDEETAERLAALDRLMGAIHRERRSRIILGAIGSGVIAILTVLAFAVM
mgnify:CR=1 FL=1